MTRSGRLERDTTETRVAVEVRLDGRGTAQVGTGVAFFDHMLTLFAHHGRFDLRVEVRGDLAVDSHHTVEDTGIVLGQAFARAWGDKAGMFRYGHVLLPMDETLVRVALDVSGRPLLVYRLPEELRAVAPALVSGKDFPFSLVEEFLRAFATQAGLTLHVEILAGREPHHLAEGVFKGLARALDTACRLDPRVGQDVPSTKGTLV